MVTGKPHPTRPRAFSSGAAVRFRFSVSTVGMMIRLTSQNMNLFKMLCLKLLTFELVYIIQGSTSVSTTMYLGAFENQAEEFAESGFGLLEKSQFLTLLHPQSHHSDPIECNFQEIFLTSIAPNCSTISICTQEDRNIEVFSLADEFLGESVDHFFEAEQDQKQLPRLPEEVSIEKAPEPKNALQDMFMDAEAGQRQEEPQNSHDQTKNIPKNYIKAIFTFILQNEDYIPKLMKKLCSQGIIPSGEAQALESLLAFVRQEKKLKKYTIQRLKNLWTHPQTGKAMRIISCEFLRKRSMGYIFGSKIGKKMSHIRHRYKFIRAIQNPAEFTSIK